MTTSTCTSALFYEDPAAALAWLERAFGFETTMRITDDSGKIVHSEMEAEGNRIMIGSGGWLMAQSPKAIGGSNTQSLRLEVDDIEAHCARAKKAGAKIVEEPTDQFYGARTYRALDPEGHMWTFSRQLQDVPLKQAGKAIGLNVELLDKK